MVSNEIRPINAFLNGQMEAKLPQVLIQEEAILLVRVVRGTVTSIGSNFWSLSLLIDTLPTPVSYRYLDVYRPTRVTFCSLTIVSVTICHLVATALVCEGLESDPGHLLFLCRMIKLPL